MKYFEKEIDTERGKLVFAFQKIKIKNESCYCIYTQSIIFIMRKTEMGSWDFPETAFPFIPEWISKIKQNLNHAIQDNFTY